MNNNQYHELVAKLPISKHCLDDELEVQASIQFEISEHLSKARQHMDMLENELEGVESKVFIRSSGNTSDTGKKPSIEYVKNTVRSDAERTKKWLDLNAARADFEKWEGLYYAWRSRNDALRALASLATANYFAVDSTYKKNRNAVERHHEERTTRPIRRRTQT